MKSVSETWTTRMIDVSITDVFLRIENVLCNILGGVGSNNLVKKTRIKTQGHKKQENHLFIT